VFRRVVAGWSQVAAQRLKIRPRTDFQDQDASTVEQRSKIIAVDLLPIQPIPGVHTLRGDFTAPDTRARVSELVGDRGVDVVLSDMCANISGG
jgi:23S rRNA (uridine2552-2'-O)-methyltransferase